SDRIEQEHVPLRIGLHARAPHEGDSPLREFVRGFVETLRLARREQKLPPGKVAESFDREIFFGDGSIGRGARRN
ncbi:MAG: hypothetical protein M3Z85_01170, partial [Acidobacteriota bacterium]|nr:hypothetical protein [Acidobacteriota bacterium]